MNQSNIWALRMYCVKLGIKSILQEICGNRIKAGFFNIIIQDIAVQGTID